MAVTLSDRARQYIALFEDITDATASDCVVFEEVHAEGDSASDEGGSDPDERVLFLVEPGDMGAAIGPNGQHVRRVENRIDANVTLVEDADTPEEFVANALSPAAVYNVTISENDDRVAYVEVDEADTGVAIGRNGSNIDAARTLADRHFDIDDIQLT